jgi:hypothetical protein
MARSGTQSNQDFPDSQVYAQSLRVSTRKLAETPVHRNRGNNREFFRKLPKIREFCPNSANLAKITDENRWMAKAQLIPSIHVTYENTSDF